MDGFFELLMANYMKIPLYVAVESFKFIRFYPLKQADLPNSHQYSKEDQGCADNHPDIDYTPPYFIKFLITDVGVLTPSAVSDELIKLYN
ncbi:hypothetical protein MXB_5503 [Myxobolus squamalis]|nr:hypothetical protein MXB_5503 [Myxobolus squamalis]